MPEQREEEFLVRREVFKAHFEAQNYYSKTSLFLVSSKEKAPVVTEVAEVS